MLSEKLDEYSVNQLDLVSIFKSQDSVLYHTRDSHWTNEGAVLVYNALMDRFGIKHDDLSSVYKHSEMIWHGDLDRMLFPSLEKLSEQIVYDMDFSFDYTYNFRSEDDYLISAKTVKKLKMFLCTVIRSDARCIRLLPKIPQNPYFQGKSPTDLICLTI